MTDREYYDAYRAIKSAQDAEIAKIKKSYNPQFRSILNERLKEFESEKGFKLGDVLQHRVKLTRIKITRIEVQGGFVVFFRKLLKNGTEGVQEYTLYNSDIKDYIIN